MPEEMHECARCGKKCKKLHYPGILGGIFGYCDECWKKMNK